MITKFKIFENKSIDTEYIFECSIGYMCEQDCEYIEGLDDFDYEDYQDYLNEGAIWEEYYEYMFTIFGIEWETIDDEIKIWTKVSNNSTTISNEGYESDDYESLRNLVNDALDLHFRIYENENHPEVIKRKRIKQYNI